MLDSLKSLLPILLSYCLGCLAAGYYLVRWRLGKDIRETGSGSVGARNVGRVLGPVGFVATFLLDFSKGALAIWLAISLGLSPWGVAAVMVAVVMGHLWPAQLGFKGGKGIATSLGAVTAHDWLLTVILLLVFAIMWTLTRKFTLSGLVTAAVSPIVCVFLRYPPAILTGIIMLAILITIAHRENLRMMVATRRDRKAPGTRSKGTTP